MAQLPVTQLLVVKQPKITSMLQIKPKTKKELKETAAMEAKANPDQLCWTKKFAETMRSQYCCFPEPIAMGNVRVLGIYDPLRQSVIKVTTLCSECRMLFDRYKLQTAKTREQAKVRAQEAKLERNVNKKRLKATQALEEAKQDPEWHFEAPWEELLCGSLGHEVWKFLCFKDQVPTRSTSRSLANLPIARYLTADLDRWLRWLILERWTESVFGTNVSISKVIDNIHEWNQEQQKQLGSLKQLYPTLHNMLNVKYAYLSNYVPGERQLRIALSNWIYKMPQTLGDLEGFDIFFILRMWFETLHDSMPPPELDNTAYHGSTEENAGGWVWIDYSKWPRRLRNSMRPLASQTYRLTNMKAMYVAHCAKVLKSYRDEEKRKS